jgi:hypothetical protein
MAWEVMFGEVWYDATKHPDLSSVQRLIVSRSPWTGRCNSRVMSA